MVAVMWSRVPSSSTKRWPVSGWMRMPPTPRRISAHSVFWTYNVNAIEVSQEAGNEEVPAYIRRFFHRQTGRE